MIDALDWIASRICKFSHISITCKGMRIALTDLLQVPICWCLTEISMFTVLFEFSFNILFQINIHEYANMVQLIQAPCM